MAAPSLLLPIDALREEGLRDRKKEVSGLALVIDIELIHIDQDHRVLLRQIEHLATEPEDGAVTSTEFAQLQYVFSVLGHSGFEFGERSPHIRRRITVPYSRCPRRVTYTLTIFREAGMTEGPLRALGR